jgi:hypothetical protein
MIAIRIPPPTPPLTTLPMIDPISSPPAPGGCPKRLKNHSANSTSKDTGDRIPRSPQTLVFENRAGYIAPNGAANEIDNETDNILTISFS